ncbi:MAG: hypothetical protein ACKVU1_03965 [bacterium]
MDGRAFTVFAFFACFFLFFASGRLGSGDAYEQLRAAMVLVNTGELGARTPPGDAKTRSFPWLLATDGKYYEPHDIGNVVVMIPAAALGSLFSKAPLAEKIAYPSILTRVAVAMSMACLSAVGCYFMFRLLCLYNSSRIAFCLSLGFPMTTIFWVYSKVAFDVLGGCCFMAASLYFSARIARGQRELRNAFFASVALATACSFRFSLVPFFAPSLVLLIVLSRRRAMTCSIVASATFLAVMLPSFVYNYVRGGSPFLPANASPIYANNALSTEVLRGAYGLLLGPNRGLFLYSPVLLLALGAPWWWSKCPTDERRVFACFGLGSALYFTMIAMMTNWGQWGWGPRYLLPILPFLYLVASRVGVRLWNFRRWRPLVLMLSIASAALSAAPVLVNWHVATATSPGASAQDAAGPYQQLAVWRGLLMGIQGDALPVLPEFADDPIRSAGSRFPDLWTARLMERSRVGWLAGLAIGCSLALGGAALLRRILIPSLRIPEDTR